jgi:hypothetical protein
VSVRPEFGPSLPALLAARGMSRRTMVLGAVLLAAVAVAGWVVVQALRDREHLVVDGPREFNMVYAPSVLHEADSRDGELVRLEGARKRLRVELTVRPVTVPAYDRGNVVGGYLPLLAEQRLDDLRGIYGPVAVFDEGKSRLSGQPGYQIGFGARAPNGQRVFGRDAFVFPDDPQATKGVLVSLRRYLRGRQRPADDEWFDKAKEAYTSFAFGSGQP